MSTINITPFEEIPVSTNTTVVPTNLLFPDMKRLFEVLPVTPYVIAEKKRGRKKKTTVSPPAPFVPTGSIVTLKYENCLRGVLLKNKPPKAKKSYFRNSITVVMVIGDKAINFKICRNGTIQMTGTKSEAQVETAINFIWSYIKDHKELYTFTKNSHPDSELELTIVPAMRNIDFSLGFFVDQKKMDRFFLENGFCSILETSVGYTGINIKIPCEDEKKLENLSLTKITFMNDGRILKSSISYIEHLNSLSSKEKKKKLDKTTNNTILVFQSGKAILSSKCAEIGSDAYYKFMKLVSENRNSFEEKLIV